MLKLLTGSQVYGPFSGESDIDIVIIQDDASSIELSLLGTDIKYKGDYDCPCFYFKIGEMTFNIIIANDENDFNAWKFATDQLKINEPIQDRAERLSKHAELRKQYLELL